MEQAIKIHIVFTVYDKAGDYTRHLAAAMASIFANTHAGIHVHLLHDETLIAENRSRLEAICRDYKQTISFHHVFINIDLGKYPALKNFSIGTMFRLKIMEIFPEQEKLIYLDNDVIFTLDIKDLWDEDISGSTMGVVADPCTYALETIPAERMAFYRKVPIMNAKYFNAGILYLNLQELRQRKYDLFNNCMGFLNVHPDAPVVDQDALNAIFQESCTFLNEKYNRLVPYYSEYCRQRNTQKNAVWHFAGHKPWELRSSPLDNLYWQYLRLTPWADEYDIGVIYDSFVYNGEAELLELRLQALYEVVDYFIIVEMKTAEAPNELQDVKHVYPQFSDKIIDLKISLPQEYMKDCKGRERIAKNCLTVILRTCHSYDLILLSDIEELPKVGFLEKIAALRNLLIKTPLVFEQDVYAGYINLKTDKKRVGTVISRQKYIIQSLGDVYANRDILPRINDGGWCFSYFGQTFPIELKNHLILTVQEIDIKNISVFVEKHPHLYFAIQ